MPQKTKQPQEIVIEGVIIRAASVHNSDKREARIEFSASFGRELRTMMSWEEPPDGYGAIDLVGTIPVSQVVLTPNSPISTNGKLESLAETFPAFSLDHFNLIPLKDTRGEVSGRELRFTLHSAKLNVAGLAGRYVAKLGRSPGTLLLTVAEQEEQQELAAEE